MKLSITVAWNEAAAFVKQEAGTLFLIVFGLSVLPGLIFQAIAQRFMTTLVVRPGGPPPDAGPFLHALPIFLLLLIPVFVLSIWGNLTINILALRRETVIGSAFSHAARRILPLLGAWLILFVAVLVIFVPLGLLMSASALGGHVGMAFLAALLIWAILIFFGVRLMLMVPVAATEPVGPVALLARSWELTSGHFWKLLGFLALLMVVFLVLLIVVGAVGGIVFVLIAGPPAPGSIASFITQLIMGILEAVFLTYFLVTVARIYEQLTGRVASVGQVFE